MAVALTTPGCLREPIPNKSNSASDGTDPADSGPSSDGTAAGTDATSDAGVTQKPADITELCPIVKACEFGFTEAGCLTEFLSHCKPGGDTNNYLVCVQPCMDAYALQTECSEFNTCEAKCWIKSGCDG